MMMFCVCVLGRFMTGRIWGIILDTLQILVIRVRTKVSFGDEKKGFAVCRLVAVAVLSTTTIGESYYFASLHSFNPPHFRLRRRFMRPRPLRCLQNPPNPIQPSPFKSILRNKKHPKTNEIPHIRSLQMLQRRIKCLRPLTELFRALRFRLHSRQKRNGRRQQHIQNIFTRS